LFDFFLDLDIILKRFARCSRLESLDVLMVDLMPLIVDEQHRAGPQKEANEVREDEVIEVMVYSKLNQAGADDPMRSGKDLDNAHQTYLQFFRE
jgi:hypothetical protein